MTPELFIASPLYGGMCHATYKNAQIATMKALMDLGVVVHFVDDTNDALVSRARNRLANTALESSMTHLLFWDGDTAIEAGYILELLGSELSVVAAPVGKKEIDWRAVKQAIANNPNISADQLDGVCSSIASNRKSFGIDSEPVDLSHPMKVLDQGTGIMMIRRHVLEDLILRFPDEWYYDWQDIGGKKLWDFFPVGIDKQRRVYLPEDYGFCKRVAQIGISVWLCPWMKTTHAGTRLYKGNLIDIATCLMREEPVAHAV